MSRNPNAEKLNMIMDYLSSKEMKYFSLKEFCSLYGSIEIIFRAPRLQTSHIQNYRLLIACPCDMDTKKYLCETCRIQKDGSLIAYKKNEDCRMKSIEDLMVEIKWFYYRFICLATIRREILLRSIRNNKREIPGLMSLSRMCLHTNDLEYVKILELPLK